MNKKIRELILTIVAILLLIATIAINFVGLVKYEMMEYKLISTQNSCELMIESQEAEMGAVIQENIQLREENKKLKEKLLKQ